MHCEIIISSNILKPLKVYYPKKNNTAWTIRKLINETCILYIKICNLKEKKIKLKNLPYNIFLNCFWYK